jgi:8-oxo-dGTP diphosphatase
MTTSNHDSETPAHGQQVITAVALIHTLIDGKPHVLAAKRADTKKFLPGKFELPGGHIDFGENLETGLAREIQEEFNASIRIGAPFGAFTYTNHVKGSHSVEIVYFATLIHGPDSIQLNPEDHSEVTWISLDTLGILEEVNGADDQEFPYVKLGLELLSGAPLNFGSDRP